MSRGKLPEPEIKFGPAPEVINAAFSAARNPLGTQEEVAEEVGVSATTLGNYEGKSGRWMNPIRYLAYLIARTNDEGRGSLLAMIGIAHPNLDPQISTLAQAMQGAKQYSDWPNRLWQIENALGLHASPSGREDEAGDRRPPRKRRGA